MNLSERESSLFVGGGGDVEEEEEVDEEVDEGDDADPTASLLRPNKAHPLYSLMSTPAYTKWRRVVQNSLSALVLLGVVQFVVGVLVGRHSFAGSIVAYVLGLLGVTSAALSGGTLYGLVTMSRNRPRALSLLSLFAHAGTVLLVAFFTLGVGVLSVSGLFWDYTNVHWAEEHGDLELFTLSKAEAQAQVRRTVLSLGVLSLASVGLLLAALIGTPQLQTSHWINTQTFFWSNLTLGTSGCVLLSISVYSLYHTGIVPVSQHESLLVLLMGSLIYALSLFAMYRVWHRKRRQPLSWAVVHSGGLLLTGVFLAAFSSVLFYRSTHVDDYLRADNDFSRYGWRTVGSGGASDLHQLRVHAQLRLTLYGLAVFVSTVYVLTAGVFALLLENILVQEHEGSSAAEEYGIVLN